MRFTFVTAFAVCAVVTAIACGSSDSSDPDGSSSGGSSSGGASSSGGGASSSGGASSGADAKPPPVPKDFPLTLPSVGGYKLENFVAENIVYVPAALVWPKVAGAKPFALERMGQIIRVGATREEILDFQSEVHMEGEGGALGLALHPQFGDGSGAKPYAYVWYNAAGGKQRLVRFTYVSAQQKFDAASEQLLVEVPETHTEHNGGKVAFGPDGFLYFSNGDDLDPLNHQTITRAPFAGLFRIDVDMQGGAVSHAIPRQPEGGSAANYFIPNDNPFVGQLNAIEEFWALGLRNPFSFSFDRMNGQMWAGDVGDSFREEVNLIVKGGNYEWPYKEAELSGYGPAPTIGTSQGPKYFFSHSSMADPTAILGGFIYRGKTMPELVGKYIYSDWPSSRIWALDVSKTPAVRTTLVSQDFGRQPVGLMEDEDGEIYALFIGGIAKLARDSSQALVPKTLTETKIWKDLAKAQLTDEFVPYEINSPLWSDGAAKKRFISVPPGKKVDLDPNGNLVFPVGTRLVKFFDLPDGSRRIEVRVLVVADTQTYGLSYKWNATQDDGDLVTEPTDETVGNQMWHFPAFGECWSCHRTEPRVLGFNPMQLNLTRADGTKQLDALAAASVFDATKISTFPDGLPKPSDTTKTIEERALAYLAANCSGCHYNDSYVLGGTPTWRGEPGVALADRNLLNAPHHNYPMASGLGLGDSPLIDPGNPSNSILLARIKSTDEKLRMPPLGRNMVDPAGAALIESWIASLP